MVHHLEDGVAYSDSGRQRKRAIVHRSARNSLDAISLFAAKFSNLEKIVTLRPSPHDKLCDDKHGIHHALSVGQASYGSPLSAELVPNRLMDGAGESQIRHVSPFGTGRMLKILGILARSAQPLSLTRRARGRRVRHRCDGDDDAYIRRVSPLGAGRMVGNHVDTSCPRPTHLA